MKCEYTVHMMPLVLSRTVTVVDSFTLISISGMFVDLLSALIWFIKHSYCIFNCCVFVTGWINRQQFEETWMSLLAVLNPVIEDVSEHIPQEVSTDNCPGACSAEWLLTKILLYMWNKFWSAITLLNRPMILLC